MRTCSHTNQLELPLAHAALVVVVAHAMLMIAFRCAELVLVLVLDAWCWCLSQAEVVGWAAGRREGGRSGGFGGLAAPEPDINPISGCSYCTCRYRYPGTCIRRCTIRKQQTITLGLKSQTSFQTRCAESHSTRVLRGHGSVAYQAMTSVPRRLLDIAMRKFRRELRVYEAFVCSTNAANESANEIELETDFEDVIVATEVTDWMVPWYWGKKAAMVLDEDGVLRLTGLRDTSEYTYASSFLDTQLHQHCNRSYVTSAATNLVSPPGMPQYFVQHAMALRLQIHDPHVVIDVDCGFHSTGYWMERARTYLTDPRVSRVLIVQFFPLRRSALSTGLLKRAAVAVVLGRVASESKPVTMQQQQATGDYEQQQQQASSDYEVGILEEKSFGNVPLASNIRQALAAVSTVDEAAPRDDPHFDEPTYAEVPIPWTTAVASRFQLSQLGQQHPHLLTIETDAIVTPLVVNLGVVFAVACEGWMRDQEKPVRRVAPARSG